MRYGSLGRIIASSVAASSISDRKVSISEKTPEQQEEYRKELSMKIMKCLNQSNMNGLAKLIREKFHEASLLITPEVFEPITGRADIMIMFSLLLETYPDSVWTTTNVSNNSSSDTITCLYLFKGTKLFSYPLSSLFRQIKAHIAKLPSLTMLGEGDNEELNSNRLVNEVADYIHIGSPVTPASTSLTVSSLLNATSTGNKFSAPSAGGGGGVTGLAGFGGGGGGLGGSFRTSFSSIGGGDDYNKLIRGRSESSDGHNSDILLSESINIPRRNQTLREVKSIETAVLKEGATSYRRKIDFVFNEIDQIIRVVIINVIS
jgi:hypothetical protein